MLHLHHADELDPLLDALAEVLGPAPADPFTPDIVVVPAAGMQDAAMVGLGRRLGATGPDGANGDGITANVEFMFPGRFVARALGDTTRGDDPEGDPWRLPRLTWSVLDVLAAGVVEVPGPSGPRADRWVLARRIADLFDRYATQRSRLVTDWAEQVDGDGTRQQNGAPVLLDPAHRWQADLWRAVRTHIGTPSAAERLPALLGALRDGTVQPELPARVSLFGVSGVAPTLLRVLQALADTREVHVFLRHPSRIAWASSPHRLAGALNLRTQVDVTIATHHPLLASWGRPALEARALLNGDAAIVEHPRGVAPDGPATTLLKAVQQGIRLDRRPALQSGIDAADGSFQVHACHGEVRQLETLRDVLGHAFVADPTLQPHEVLVLCPDLERFAPLVAAVFQRGPLPVPVRIGDRSLTSDDPIVEALQSLLSLVSGRATISEVLALVQYEPVRRRFGWSIDDIEQFAAWCATLGARWGLSARHRTAWGLPGDLATGTWRSVIDQLLAGVAIAASSPRVVLGDIAPYDDISTSELELVGSVADLLARLVDLHDAVLHERPIDAWIDMLHGVVDEFCAVDREEPWVLQRVHRELTDIALAARSPHQPDATCEVPLTLADLRAVLSDSISDRPGRLPLRSGSVTVSSMVPQHGVPARVICLLGLDDGSLRGGTFDGDDILGIHPCVGERHPRHESRQLLLDAVLGARERLIITCNGADLTTNKETPFVVPLAELLDVVGLLVGAEASKATQVHHPRHGFNEKALQPGRLWSGAAGPFTFDPAMLSAAEALRRAAGAAPPTTSRWALPARPLDTVDIDELVAVVGNPARTYLKGRLDVRLPGEAAHLDDGLAISIDPLTKSGLGRELLDVHRLGHAPGQWDAAARLRGAMPPGELSSAALGDVFTEVDLLEAVAAHWSVPVAAGDEVLVECTLPVAIDAAAPADIVLAGKVRGVVAEPHRSRVLQLRFSRPRPSFRLGLALQVAALQLQQPEVDWSGVVVSRGGGPKPEAHGLRIRGAGADRTGGAERLLSMATQLFAWASRDAVPLFDRASFWLAEENTTDADSGLEEDGRDQYVAVVWPEVTLDALLDDPMVATDPPLGATDPSLSRARAVARWVWGTYRETVEEIDESGHPVEATEDGATGGGGDE